MLVFNSFSHKKPKYHRKISLSIGLKCHIYVKIIKYSHFFFMVYPAKLAVSLIYEMKTNNICLNHIKQSAQEGFLPIKFYNLPINAKPEPVTIFSVSAKDFILEKGLKSLNQTTKKLPSQKTFNRPISPEETYIDDLLTRQNTLPIMKPFSAKPLRTSRKKVGFGMREREIEKDKSLLFIEGFSSMNKKNEIQNEYRPKISKFNEKPRPLTSKSQMTRTIDFANNFSSKNKKKAGYPYEMKGLIKVGEVYDLLRLSAYERVKRKEEIEKILDIPNQDLMIQRPMSSDQLIRYSQQKSVKLGMEEFLNRRLRLT